MRAQLLEDTSVGRYPSRFKPFIEATIKAVETETGDKISTAIVLGMALESLQDKFRDRTTGL